VARDRPRTPDVIPKSLLPSEGMILVPTRQYSMVPFRATGLIAAGCGLGIKLADVSSLHAAGLEGSQPLSHLLQSTGLHQTDIHNLARFDDSTCVTNGAGMCVTVTARLWLSWYRTAVYVTDQRGFLRGAVSQE
jgi:hypothetical protein